MDGPCNNPPQSHTPRTSLGDPTKPSLATSHHSLTHPRKQAVRRDLAFRLDSEDRAELPATVGGLPGAAPVGYLPVIASVVVEIEAGQERPQEFGRFRHRPRVLRIRDDMTVALLPPVP